MLFVTIQHDKLEGKDYIFFCSDTECIKMELVDRELNIFPFTSGRIKDEFIPELIHFLKENCDEKG